MEELLQGYRRFRRERWPERREVFERLADDGQAPRAMVVACSDSRVDPTMIFSAEPGKLFILRNVANLVPPYAPDSALHATSAALEFAIRVLEVSLPSAAHCCEQAPMRRVSASGNRSNYRSRTC